MAEAFPIDDSSGCNAPGLTKQKRAGNACTQCRSLKVKCVREAEGQPCLKCLKSGSQCVVYESRPTTRAVRRPAPRIAKLESKIDGILNLLSRPTCPADDGSNNPLRQIFSSDDGLRPVDETKTLVSEDTTQARFQVEAVVLSPQHSDVYDATNIQARLPDQNWKSSPSSDWNSFSRLELSGTVLQYLFDEFCEMKAYFPFVTIAEGTTVAFMIAHQPFLLLAAITSAASKYPQLQKSLYQELKGILGRRLLEASEVDLDLLQGLLVNIAWFHFHLIPRSQQLYRFLQLAISMVVDLGLDQKPSDIVVKRADMHLTDSPVCSPRSTDNHVLNLEAIRAYLGCYYLSVNVSMFQGKPNNLPFSHYMLECAVRLQHANEVETDRSILPLIKMQHLAEEAEELYRHETSLQNQSRLYIHAERLATHIEEWNIAVPLDLQPTVLLKMNYYALKTKVYDMGLVVRYGQGKPRPNEDLCFRPAHSALIANLIKCLDATKDYLNSFFSFTISDYTRLPFCEWIRYVVITFALYKLSVGLHSVPDWDKHAARETIDIEEILYSLADNLRTVQNDIPYPASCRGNLFAMFPQLLESVKISYSLAKDDDASHGQNHGLDQHLNILKGLNPDGTNSCPAFQQLKKSASLGGSTSIEHLPLDDGIAAEIVSIESQKMWADLVMDDAFADLASI